MPQLNAAQLAEAIEGASSLILRFHHDGMRQLSAKESEILVAALRASLSERGDTSDVVNRLDAKIAKHVAVRGEQPIGIEEQLLRDAREALRYAGHVRMEQDSRACPYLQCSIQGCNRSNCVNK